MALPQKIALALSGTGYQLTLHWCAPATCWILDIADQNGNPLIQGLQLVTGAGLLAQYEYVGIVGDLLAQTDFDPSAVPTFENLGTTSQLYYVVQ